MLDEPKRVLPVWHCDLQEEGANRILQLLTAAVRTREDTPQLPRLAHKARRVLLSSALHAPPCLRMARRAPQKNVGTALPSCVACMDTAEVVISSSMRLVRCAISSVAVSSVDAQQQEVFAGGLWWGLSCSLSLSGACGGVDQLLALGTGLGFNNLLQGTTLETILEPLVKKVTIRSGVHPHSVGQRGYVVILHTNLGPRGAGINEVSFGEDGGAELAPGYSAWLAGAGLCFSKGS